MTQALDAAIRAAEAACLVPPDGGSEKERLMCAEAGRRALRAALPAEPAPEAIEAIARGLARLRVQQNQEKWNRPPVDVERAVEYAWKDFIEDASAPYRALRAHLLGEDA